MYYRLMNRRMATKQLQFVPPMPRERRIEF